MLETVIISAAIVGFGTFVVKSRIRGESRFSEVESSWNNTLLSFVRDNGLDGVDIELKPETNIKKKSDDRSKVSFIAPSIEKGYDLIDSFMQKGYSFGPHFHRGSSEFFYVISGKIKVAQCKNKPSDCLKTCGGACGLFTDSPYTENNIITTLNPGDNLFVPASKFHTFEALEDSRVIVVTLPPISEIEYKKVV